MDPAPTPQYQQPADDPKYLQLKAQADADNVAALKDRAGLESADLMARYGQRLTSAAAAGSSPAAADTTTPGATAPLPGTGSPFGTPDIVNALFGQKVA